MDFIIACLDREYSLSHNKRAAVPGDSATAGTLPSQRQGKKGKMARFDSTQLATELEEQRQEIVVAWTEALYPLCDPSWSRAEVALLLTELTAHLIPAFTGDPFYPASAQEIGARLVSLGYGHAQILAQSQRLLGNQLGARLPSENQAHLHSRIRAVLAEIGAGFIDQLRRNWLQDRDERRTTLLLARKEAEEALRAERDFVNVVLDTADALIMVTNAHGQILRFNRACEQVSGYQTNDVEGRHAAFLVPEELQDDLSSLGVQLADRPASGLPLRYENWWRSRSGERRQISWSVTALYAEDGAITHFVGTGLDVTEQRAIEDELTQARRQLALAEEEERIRLAQDLHDEAVQQLLGLSYQLADMQARAADDSEWSAAQRLEEVIPGLEVMRQEIVAVAQGLRRLIGELRPPGLRDIALYEALAGYLEAPEWSASNAAPAVTLDLPRRFERDLPESTRNCLFRVAQEALWNARKHAAARNVTVSARSDGDHIWLRIEDDGAGFEIPLHLHRFAANQRFGLLGMQERVAAEGGELTVVSTIGAGTKVEARVPWH